jgi:hypothetical protein
MKRELHWPTADQFTKRRKSTHENSELPRVLTAAFTGLLGGTMARLNAAPPSDSSNPTMSSRAGQLSTPKSAEKEDHACQGQNSCKGCATDGSKMQ